jgi:hypothetical protein
MGKITKIPGDNPVQIHSDTHVNIELGGEGPITIYHHESSGPPPAHGASILMETGDYLLLESGDTILLEA